MTSFRCVPCATYLISREAATTAWRFRPLSDMVIEDARLLPLIHAFYGASFGVYGYRRISMDLKETGETCGKHRVYSIMKAHNIKAITGYKKTKSCERPPIVPGAYYA